MQAAGHGFFLLSFFDMESHSECELMASTSTGPACLLSALKSQYQFVHDHEHPVPEPHEILIQIEAVGLNPIGKAPSALRLRLED